RLVCKTSVNHCSDRNLYDLVRRIFAMHFLPSPMTAVFCFKNRLVKKMGEMVGLLIGPQNDIATSAAIATVGSAFRDEFFAPETDTTASAFSSLRKIFDAIDKHVFASCHSAKALSSRGSIS